MASKSSSRPKLKIPKCVRPKEVPTIQECPGYEVCKSLQVSCTTCLDLDPLPWRDHVLAVLARQNIPWPPNGSIIASDSDDLLPG